VQLAKVEPLERALRELKADAWINGRRRDQGADRASLPVFEAPTAAGGLVKVNPLAHWTFGDCFASLARHQAPQHPLHADGYPSIGDVHSTLPVPREKWFVYGGERSGRFQGLENKDGSAKTECGIHNKMGGGGAPASSGLKPPAEAAASSSLLRPS
jgi:phosphoadenosine phosphosulfate reductase